MYTWLDKPLPCRLPLDPTGVETSWPLTEFDLQMELETLTNLSDLPLGKTNNMEIGLEMTSYKKQIFFGC